MLVYFSIYVLYFLLFEILLVSAHTHTTMHHVEWSKLCSYLNVGSRVELAKVRHGAYRTGPLGLLSS